MRAVKSIIVAAANALKNARGDTNISEEVLVYRVIIDCNIPKFTEKDVPLFEAIMADLFPLIIDK